MKKVLVVATSPKSRGGIATVVNALRETDVWSEHKCCWVATHIDRSKLHKAIKLLVGLLKYIVLLPWYDIVHIHLSTTVSANRKYIFYKMARLFRKKVVVHLHCGSQLSEIWSSKYEDMFRNSSMCIVLSNSIREMIVARTGKADNVRVVYNPSPSGVVVPKSEERNKVILFAATLYREKGYLDLIEAFALIAPKYPDWKLVLAGNGSQERGLGKAMQLRVGNRVEFVGWVRGAEKDRVFRSASIFCLPSYAEGFPMAVLDAWAYGLPVVTTPVGGVPDIVVDGENGLLFTPGDVATLANKLSMLIESEELRATISKESLHLANTTFNVNTIANELANIYKDIYGTKK